MKRSKLEAVLRRKFRIRITKRRRGRFTVTVPVLKIEAYTVTRFARRTEALQSLYAQLRCLEPIMAELKGHAR